MCKVTFRRRSVLVLLLTAVATLAGCSDKQKAEVAMRRACLGRLGEAYLQYHAAEKRSPAGVEEFATYVLESAKKDDETAKALATRMQERDIVVFWNANLDSAAENNGQHVLAFEATCPGNGGYMVTVDGTVDHVTAKKFGEMTEVEHTEAE
ncbi:MAG: hypothetical protein WBD20_24400 [Pirellulaceae bacterium]